ncbi:UDP-N-acetylglucosamine 2-epimerase (hydrolyzing) [Sphingomonas gei]|uniref:UDP-N-acetylglucosamine 2-epimerase (Hydrolyzing) n=1 Tax=Sphingomonas gei TaxID=1395960 RepID=A0A4S1X3R7_9SPHN|nr:UDP-N-acetylglucosamine 2-epimerase [Sphingomonas gei]TGX50383.1 UDP-N-acetylglucosamine 2-epimerase (hydrolyzing) [Sphingomonas gei]
MIRKILYVSGTRADYGLMEATLQRIAAHPGLELGLVVTGMHLDPRYGATIEEIERAGLHIAGRIPSEVAGSTGAEMARGIATMLAGLTTIFEREVPDLVLLLGDRGEMLAAAIAAIHLNIPIVHIHGGERSGTVDEPVRHAISKLAHYHFAATDEARERLIRMGEEPARVTVVGAPGLVGLADSPRRTREALAGEAGFDPTRPIALMVYHPVLQDAGSAGAETAALLAALAAHDCQVLALLPNADAGGQSIREALETARGNKRVKIVTHLSRRIFIEWMAVADLMVGNSSSGIIEAATFGTPVVNVGPRQNLRQRNGNVIDVPPSEADIATGLQAALAAGRYVPANVYGDGLADQHISNLLATMALHPDVLRKSNAF